MVMADYLTLSKNTVGHHLYWAKANIDYDYVFAWTIIIVILSLLLDNLLRLFVKMYNK
jgi:ABC-type nitrate/sulfonate/bicarbonate transport system permease component